MKTKLKLGKSLFIALSILSSTFSFAQSYQDSLKKDDDDIITSIAPYSADVRDAILNASQYSQKLVKIERIQARTSQSFQDLLASSTHEEQEKYYELGRYPDLIHQLVNGPPQTLDQVKPTLTSYPKEVSDAVSALYPMHLQELQSMDKIYQSSQKALEDIIKDLPSNVQGDFRKIVGMPEVMSLLTERIDLAVSLGDAYKNDPQGTKRRLDSLSTQINAQNQKDLDDYKKQVASDPQMQEEMKKSAQDFADSYSANGETQGPSDAALDQGQQPVQQQQDQSQPQVVNNYYGSNYDSNPYPYWFGYPSWYASPMWYPRPLYYHTGFYIGAGGAIVVLGLPSRAYSGWFFNYGYQRYPRYYNYCNTYYNAHRTYVNHINLYHGFNSNVNRHFARVNRDNVNRNVSHNAANERRNVNVNREAKVNREANVNREAGNRSAPSTPNRNSNSFRNSINSSSNTVNHQAYNNFHASQFHQQSWGGVGGGGARPSSGGGSGFHPSGGGGGHGRR